MEQQKKKLTEAEREAIALKYKRRIIELGIPIFGVPPAEELEEFGNVVQFHDPHAAERAEAVARSKEKSKEFEQRILDSTIQLLAAAPRPDEGRPNHRKPGDLRRTAERLRTCEVDLPDPSLDREAEADAFDRYANFELAQIALGKQIGAVRNEVGAKLLPVLMTLMAFAQDVLHVLKEWAREDPEGPAAGYFRDFNRAWRQGTAKPRGRVRRHGRA